jgi:hypothetical protein
MARSKQPPRDTAAEVMDRARHGPSSPVRFTSALDKLRARLKLSRDADVEAVAEAALGELDRLANEKPLSWPR